MFFTVKSLRLLQFSCYEKNKECFGMPDKLRKFSLAVFFKFDLVFSHNWGGGGGVGGENCIKFEFFIYSNFWQNLCKNEIKI